MIRSRLLALCLVLVVVTSALGGTVLTVSAAQTDMQISSVTATPQDPTTGETVDIETTISNPQGENGTGVITAIYLRKAGEDLEEYGRIRNPGSVTPGGQTTIRMPVSFDTPGEKRIVVNVGVEDGNGNHQTYQYPVYVDVAESNVRAELATNATVDGTTVTLRNYGNVNFTDVEITASANGETIGQQYAQDVPLGSDRSVPFDTDDAAGENVTFNATYTAGGDAHSTVLTKRLEGAVAGKIDLSSVEAERRGEVVTIQGDAPNVGSTDAESVMLSVPETDRVSPVAPRGEYFIGTVEASEFATFELTTEVGTDVSAVPVEISYLVDGVRRTATQQIDLAASFGGTGQAAVGGDAQGSPGSPDAPASGGLPLLRIAFALLIVGAVGFVVYRWRGQ